MNSFSNKINSWYDSVKQLIFKFKDGFYLLPIMSNSPKTIIKSLSSMPFVKHSLKQKTFGSNNPFMNANINYFEIEKGLWYMHSIAEYKENISYIRQKDTKENNDYYLLFLEKTSSIKKVKNGLIDGVSYSNSAWVIIKPMVGNEHCRFKDSTTTSLALYMNSDWIKNKLSKNKKVNINHLFSFFDSNAKLIMCGEKIEIANQLIVNSEAIFKKITKQDKVQKAEWEIFVNIFLNQFIERCKIEKIEGKSYDLAQPNRKKIIHAEQLLLDNLYNSFMGIEAICQKVGLSPTQLKSSFKLVYGDSIFQYFRKKQLETANAYILNSNQNVADISILFGYANPSKFTAAYKKYYGILPSEVKKNK